MKLTKPTLILILGVQGSGKGTQAEILAKKLGLPHLVAGDIFRQVATEDTELGRSVKANLDQGKIMEIDQWDQAVGHYVENNDISQGAILDGFLRSIEQINHFNRIAQKQGLPAMIVVNLKLSQDKAFDRLIKRGRSDDTPEQIKERFSWSVEQMMPVIDYFRASDQVVDIDGDQAIETVQDELVTKLKQRKVIE